MLDKMNINFISYEQYLFESSIKKSNGCILFSDIVGSSILWRDQEKQMYNSLDKQYDLFDKKSSEHKGVIIKSIGDAFMVHFDDILNAIRFSIDIQKELKNKPLKVGSKILELRVGFSYGPLLEKVNDIQKCKVDDYFGNTVNTASRMESKVSPIGGFAFSSLLKFNEKEVKNILDENCKYEIIKFTENSKDIEFKRSGRLLTKSHHYITKDVDELKGIDEVQVYKCELK